MKIPTGAKPIDELLSGGVEVNAITNFCGEPGTGKTNICMISAIKRIENGSSVVFIDTEGGFSLERFGQLCKGQENKLKKIILFEPKDFREQENVIKKLDSVFNKEHVELVILDSMVALYRLECADKEIFEANRQLSKQLAMLSGISRKKNVPVIVTNHVFKKFDSDENVLVGGNTIKYWCKAIVRFDKIGTNQRRAFLIKHRSLPEGLTKDFEITESGFEPMERKFSLF